MIFMITDNNIDMLYISMGQSPDQDVHFALIYHKKINEKGEFPTRLVIPATNFTATFSKIGYLGIKRCLDKVKVNYSRFSIVQASDLKERLEEKKLVREEVTIASVYAINMYP